jgi:protein ImuB
MWLAMQFPDLGLEVFDAGDSRPTVLLEEQRVVACNEQAAAAGIACGSSLATARSIFPGVVGCRRDQARERERLQFLAEALVRFSSMVSIELPDTVVLEVGRSRRLYADLELLAEEAVAVIRGLKHRVNHQLAATPAAASLLARSGETALSQVPVVMTGLSAAVCSTLASMGIHHLGPLLALPEAELARRSGSALVNLLQRLDGRLPDPRQTITLRPEFSRKLHLLEPIRDKNTLLFPMQRLLNELEQWLLARQLAAEKLHWQFSAQSSLTGERAASCALSVSFGQGRQRKSAFLPITRLRLDQVELPEDVITITLDARSLQPHTTASHGLFDGLPQDDLMHDAAQTPSAAAQGELLVLLDELRARLGDDACHGIISAAEHTPEHAWREYNWCTEQSRSLQQGRQKSPAQTSASTRPCWLFNPPRRVEPAQLTLLRGPERIQTAWWRGGVARDYYIARHHSGASCLAFVDADGGWFLHGYFA